MTNHGNRSKHTARHNPKPSDIKAARESSGLTQTQAADLIHCNLRSWQQWEAGDRAMHPAFWELWQQKVTQ